MDAAGPGGGDAGTDAAGELRPRAGREGGGLLVPYLDEPDLVLVLAQRFDDAVHPVAGNAEYGVDAPFEHRFY